MFLLMINNNFSANAAQWYVGSEESAAQPFTLYCLFKRVVGIGHLQSCRFWERFPCIFSDCGNWENLPHCHLKWYSDILHNTLLCWGTYLVPFERETKLPATASAAMSHPYFSPLFSLGFDSPLTCMVWRKFPSVRHGFCISQCTSLHGSGLEPAWSSDVAIFHHSLMVVLVSNLQESVKDFLVAQQILSY